MTIAPMSGLEAGGLARSSDDPTMRAVLLLTMDLGIVFIRQVVEGLPGHPSLIPTW